MKILLSCLHFRNFGGSELYFYELATALQQLGHQVHIYAINKGIPLTAKTEGICFEEAYSVKRKKFDKIIFSHGRATWDVIKGIETKELINVIHSEIIPEEQPVISNKVDRYVSVRVSIRDKVLGEHGISSELIFNPFDFSRFNKDVPRSNQIYDWILFPGHINKYRVKIVGYLIDSGYKVAHVGKNQYKELENHINFVSVKQGYDMEKHYMTHKKVVGMNFGRTSIEALLCGNEVLEFTVDSNGKIEEWETVDKIYDINRFEKVNVAKQLLGEIPTFSQKMIDSFKKCSKIS
tara:strand:+ start:16943 stop:17821 length:879 start_codon:yes stop_codon:yes gene_type:complete